MSSTSLEPMEDLIASIKYLMNGSNPGPFMPNSNYRSIVSESCVEGDHDPDPEHYNGKTLICESALGHNGPLIVAVMNNLPGLIDAVENLMGALEDAGVNPGLVDAVARSQRKNGMKQKFDQLRREHRLRR